MNLASQIDTLDDALAHAWAQVSGKLASQFGDAIFRSWLMQAPAQAR